MPTTEATQLLATAQQDLAAMQQGTTSFAATLSAANQKAATNPFVPETDTIEAEIATMETEVGKELDTAVQKLATKN